MQFLSNMDCSGRSNIVERDTDLADDLSHEDHSDEDMRDCDSIEGEHLTALAARTNASTGRTNNNSNNNNNNCSLITAGDINYSTSSALIGSNRHSPNTPSDIQMNHHHHHHQFSSNHPLNALGNFMGMGLHGIPNLQHNDVLEKLKMQVRDMKVMEQDYAAAHAAAFGGNILPTPINTAFSLPPTSMASFGHAAAAVQNMSSSQAANNLSNGGTNNNNNNLNGAQNSSMSNSTPVSLPNGNVGNSSGNGGNMSFSFTSPTAPNNSKDGNLASNSSTSSEASNSSQQNNGWSFEEQYKQVRQLYEINDDPKRKEFLDDLFSFMQKRGTPINRLPIMAKSVLDLYELYNLVIARGGLVDVINKKLWQEIIKGLHLPSSITSAAFTLRTQYMKFLYPYECEKKNLSSPAELQAAIDGNRREGRRSSYGQYEGMHSPMQMQQMSRSALPGGMQQMSPLALVTHAAANNQQAQAAAAAAAAAHHRLMAPTFGQVPNLMASELEQRMMEYLKLIQVKKEQQSAAVAAAAAAAAATNNNNNNSNNNSNAGIGLAQHQQQQQHQLQQHQQRERDQRHRSQSPEITPRDALNALEMSRVALWQMYHNNTSPPASVSASPQGGPAGMLNKNAVEPQRSEALNLSDSPPNLASIKRERDRDGSPEPCDRDDDFNHQPPPPKRNPMIPAFPGGFWPSSMAAAAAAANFHQSVNAHDSDEGEHDEVDDDGEHNTTVNSTNSLNATNATNQQSNGHHLDSQQNRHNQSSHNNTNHNNNNNHHLLNTHNQSLHNLHHRSSSNSHLHNSDNKSDDSAIEHSPSTSGGNSGNGTHTLHNDGHVNHNDDDDDDDDGGNLSPISTKKIHLNKNHHHQQQQQQQQQQNAKSSVESRHKSLLTSATTTRTTTTNIGSSLSASTSINLFSGLQFQVEHNGLSALGEPQLLVNLHLNGMKYSGILLGDAFSMQNNTRETTSSNKKDCHTHNNFNNNKINKIKESVNAEHRMEVEEGEGIVEAVAAAAKHKMVTIENNNNDVAIMRVNSTKEADENVLRCGAGSEGEADDEEDKSAEDLKAMAGHNEVVTTNNRRQIKHGMESEDIELRENEDETDMVDEDEDDNHDVDDDDDDDGEAARAATKTVAEIISSGGLAISGLVAATAGLTTTTATTTSTPQLKEALLTSSS